MKCIGKENPPCNRCRQSGHVCTFDGPRKSKSSKVEDRLRIVEAQMGALQTTMEELLRLQQGGSRPMFTPQTMNSGQHATDNSFQHTPPVALSTPGTLLSLESFLDTNGGVGAAQRHSSITRENILEQRPWARPPTPPPKPSHLSSDSDDDSDPLDPSRAGAPWDNMLSLAEAARLKADGHHDFNLDGDRDSTTGKRKVEAKIYPFEPEAKRQKTAGSRPDNELKRALPLQQVNRVHAFKDPMDLGWCSEERGKQLYDVFFQRCHMYMPCFDPEVDTWDSLRRRSPFCITAIMMVGAKVEDAGGPESELQRQCREHAEKIGMSTLFTPISRIEVVQAMVIMASWGDTSWRPGGHAMRIAMDMGLYRCLPYLAQNGMGAGKTPDQIREDYPLVVGARMWLAIFGMKFTSRMAFNMGRPALFAGEETIRHSRQFLEHPLSISTDARLVSSSELLTLRLPLHQPYSILPASASMPGLDEKLIESRRKVDEWYTYWEQYFVERGVPATDLLRENIVTGRCGTFMYVNSRILHGVRNKQDIAHLSDQRKEALIIAVRAAEKLVATALRGGQYKENFRYDMGAAFASRFLIRMASLLPEAVDVRQVSRDVEQIAQLLTQVPGFQFATLLRDVLQRARRNRILPPPSKAPSPIKQIMPLPPIDWDPTLPTMTSTSTPAHNNLPPPSFNFNDLDTITTNFDFTYADQLFTNSGRTSGPPQTLTFPPETPGTNNIDSQGYLLDMWFPFPPLGEPSPPGASIGLAGPATGEGDGQPPVLSTPAALPLGPSPVQNGQSGAQNQTWW
ncbi:hypothetical protein M231_06237 [Tremella mesenterica]|uniref:Transcription factor domain-containing protein n=1 Tax=Tremella mesenterica TaxID=5217 RepID=A0A4Q1BFD5_TREME|nr:hypothetical protein M231_06237 [Tremella mesenterica]